MQNNDLVSIIIPCYNQAQYLEETVQSAIDQTYPNIEIIIINDGSPDNTQEIAEKLQKKHPNSIRILEQQNQGVSVARNNGIKESLGEYILPLDADDILDLKMISKSMDAMVQTHADIVHGGLQCFGDRHDVWMSKPFSENNILYANLPHGCSLYRKKVWIKTNGYKQNMMEGYEDWEFWINAYKNNFIFHYLPEVLYYYRVKETSRDTLAVKKDNYLKAIIKLNHPELYTAKKVQKALRTIKEMEELADLYFYYSKDISIDEISLSTTINNYLNSNKIQNIQFITIPNSKKKFGLYTLDTFNNDKQLKQLYQETDAEFILFYASLRYEVSSFQNLDFAWHKDKGIIATNGKIFPFVFKSKREDSELQLIAYKRELKYLDYKSSLGAKAVKKKLDSMYPKDNTQKNRINQLGEKIKISENRERSLIDQIKTVANTSIYKNLLHKLTRNKYLLSSFYQINNILIKKKSNARQRKNISIYNQYTVIASVYNVEAYLDDFFESLVNQTIGFEEHIYLIMVDDGSPDNSANIIKKWREKYPNNIFYHKKENGGLSSARNYGLEFCNTEWVTFIDPDDFVNNDYFKEVQAVQINHREKYFSMISCNLIFYRESAQVYKDTHPLNYRYLKGETIVTDNDLEGMFQLSAASVFLRYSIIEENLLRFDEKVVPNFEDAHLIGRYLLSLEGTYIGFLANAKYYYRKRASEDSLIDTSWSKKEKYVDVLKNGYLDLLQQAKKIKGYVPDHIQRTILYDLSWYYKYLFNRSERISFLNGDQIANFKLLLQKIFEYIDIQTIQKYNIAGFWLFHKIGLLGMQKKVDNSTQTFIITDYDEIRSQIHIRHIHYFQHNAILFINAKKVYPQFSKTLKTYFLDDIFVYETIMWLSIDNGDSLTIKTEDAKTQIYMGGKSYGEEVSLSMVKSYFNKEIIIDPFTKENGLIRENVLNDKNRKKYKDAWLFMDRDTHADDNAEHLYRYIKCSHPEINIFFGLRRDSHDWNRLDKEGFNLIEFDSYDYKLVNLYAKHIISSHIDPYVTDYLPSKWNKTIPRTIYTFLQHGITKHDLSKWFNRKHIDCFITVSKKEYNSIVNVESPYKFTKREVVLTGFPRHDSLLLEGNTMEKIILIMPTWRKYLVGKAKGMTNNRLLNNQFKNSTYFKNWNSLLQSEKLLNLSNKYGYKIIFFPHVNIQPYLNMFNLPKHIEVLSHEYCSIQNLFQRAALMITDYSSVGFEMGVLKREVLYYQFDHQHFFEYHGYKKGYFDYTKDGFGPVCYTEEDVMNELSLLLDSGGRTREKYLKRMHDFFEFHDTNNCQRVFNAIQKLDLTDTSP